MALKIIKRTTTIVTEEIDTDVAPAPDDPIVDPADPSITPDAVYPAGDYRAGCPMPRGGDDYTAGNFGNVEAYAQPTDKSSNWISNGDSLLPYFYKNAKGVDAELDLHIQEAIKGHYLARVKINSWPEEVDSANPIRAKIQLASGVGVSNQDRFWNLQSTKKINKLAPGNEYWFDITQNMTGRGLLTEGQYNVNGQVLYLYLHSNHFSSGKMCIVTDAGATWLRKGTAWVDET